MKTNRITNLQLTALALVSAFSLQPLALVLAATTVDSANQYAWGANVGWMDGRGDVANGAVIGEYVCAGYLYAANLGWISLGDGSPASGVQYQNASAGDYGVNRDSLGNLRGYAWGANIGWVAFESTGAPMVHARGQLQRLVVDVQAESFLPGGTALGAGRGVAMGDVSEL
jgi:hypothetical protein